MPGVAPVARLGHTVAKAETMLQLEPRSTALLMIDMQNDFCDPNGYYASLDRPLEAIRRAIGPARILLEQFRCVRAPVIFTRLLYDGRLPAVEERHALLPGRWAAKDRRLQPGSWGCEVIAELAPLESEFLVDKPGYSAFYSTPLESMLRQLGVRTIVLSGTTTHACVLTTAFDAFDRDFDVVVASDAVSTWFDHLQAAALDMVELLLGRSAPSDEIVAALRCVTAPAQGRG